MSRTSALTRKPKGLGRRNFAQGTSGDMRLPHRLQGQKVKSQGHGAGAYCGGHLAAQLVVFTQWFRPAGGHIGSINVKFGMGVKFHILWGQKCENIAPKTVRI